MRGSNYETAKSLAFSSAAMSGVFLGNYSTNQRYEATTVDKDLGGAATRNVALTRRPELSPGIASVDGHTCR